MDPSRRDAEPIDDIEELEEFVWQELAEFVAGDDSGPSDGTADVSVHLDQERWLGLRSGPRTAEHNHICHVGDGWREKNFSTSKCERAGYVPIKVGGFMGFGGKEAEEKCGVCWNNPAKKPGQIQCVRCGGKKFIYYRNADWR